MKGEKQNMNKLFTKIAKLSLGLAMAAGVGVAISGFGKSANSVYAASGDTHEFSNIAFSKLLNNNASIDDVEIAAQSYPVSKITANVRYNKTAGGVTITPTIGSTKLESKTHNANSTVDLDWTVNPSVTGKIVFKFVNNCGSGTGKGTFYFNSVTLTEGSGTAPTTYTVTYNANNATSGSVPTDATAYSNGATVTVKGNTGSLAKTNYEFGGWNTQTDGNGTTYSAGDTFNISANTTLYAKWDTPAAGDDLTFSLTSNPGSWPTSNDSSLTNYTYTLNSTAYTFSLKNVKCNSGYLMCTATAVVGLPAIQNKKLVKVVASNSGGCSTSTQVGVSSSSSSASYITGGATKTWSTQGSSYTYDLSGTAANTQYYLYITNKNAQITSLTLTYEDVKTLSSIALSGDYPTSFTMGDEFSHEGMVVTATYSDSTTANVTSSATFSGYEMAVAGNYTVTVSYTEEGTNKTATYSITVSAPATPYITPAKNSTSGYEGTNESISFTYGNLAGSLSITSSNTSIVTVGTPSTNAGSGSVQINFVAEGSTTVKFKDGSNELASLSVSVDPATVSISGLPASSSVFINKTLNLGSTITVTATGNLTSAVTWASDDDSIAEVSSSGVVTGVAEGTVDIIVTSDDYPSATMTCSVTVSEESGTADHPYTVNQAFAAIDANEGITGVYAQGIVSSIVTAWNTQYNNISFNISADGTTSGNQLEAFRAASSANVTLTANDNINVGDIVVVKGNLKKYNSTYEFDAACTVEIRKHISSISVTTAPTKTTYNAGESFDPTGLVVTATYDDNSTKTFSYASVGSLFTFNKTTLVKTDTVVTITLFGTFNASQSITVIPVAAVLSVTVSPDTLSLDIGESDDLTATVEVDAGASQVVTWSSSDENIATVDEYGTVSGVAKGSATITATSDFDDSKSGSCTVTVTDPNSKDYTWNLTTSSYDSSSADAIIWSNEAATITAAKGSSSTAANNQAPPAKAFTRILYSGQTFTIAPKATYTITSIVLTKSGGADISSSTWTNATASSSGNTITITPTDGTSNVSVAGSGYIQLTSIYIEYVKDTSTKSISLNDSTLDVALSSQSTTAIVETNFSGGTYTVDTNACASVTISGTTVTVTGVAVGSHTFTITETTNSLSVELTVNVYDPTDVYTKITSVTDLVDGARVYIGKITGEKLMGNKHSDKNYMDEIATGSASTTIDGSNSYVSYLIGADANGYYFKNESDNTYLCYSGSDNEMKTTDTYSDSDLTMHWTVSITDGSALVTNVGDTSRTMRYNASNTRFACYLNEGQAPVSFFVRNLAGVTSSDRVNTFSNLYMHKLDVPTSNEEYTGNCYGTDGSDGYFATARAALNSEWSSIAEAFSQSGDMWSRYVAWGDACGIAVSYSNGIQYNSRFFAPLFSTIIGKDTNTVAIIVIISMVSVTAIGGYFFLRKRKENI